MDNRLVVPVAVAIVFLRMGFSASAASAYTHDFTPCGNGHSFDASLEVWSGEANDGVSWIASGGYCQGGYHQASRLEPYTGTRVTGVDGATFGVGQLVQPMGTYCIPYTVTSTLPYAKVPVDPSINFDQIIEQAGIEGVLDPNSIKVRDLTTGQNVPCALERFDSSDTLSVEWLVEDPAHDRYEVCFTTVSQRPPAMPSAYTPPIGVGDLIRYNAGAPRPVMPGYPAASADLTGDGLPDLIGTWNYGRRPGDRWDGPTVFPRVGTLDQFVFGGMVRIYEVPDIRYSRVEAGDFDQDGLPDLVFAPSSTSTMTFYHNTGGRHANGMPIFAASGSATRNGGWNPRVVDLDNDGKLDIVCAAGFPNAETGAMESTGYLRNISSGNAWPPTFQGSGTLGTLGPLPVFFDVDGDGLKDAIELITDPADPGLSGFKIGWQKSQGGSPPRFAGYQLLSEVNDVTWRPFDLAAVNDGPQPGLIVQHHNWEQISFFTRRSGASGPPYLQLHGLARSLSAEFELSDQAWPFPCDWDGDGDWDLLVGGGYGWPRIVVNDGTNERPAFGEAQYINSEGQPIRLLRNVILGQPYLWHNMGYPYPAFVDWDGDGLPDLVIPNETNRIFWYKNIGTRQNPQFGPQQQVLVDGYGDSPALRQLSAQRALTAVYPLEQEQPFFWRTGAAFADFNGDGIMDLATHDGWSRKLTLFAQYRDNGGQLKLRKVGPLKLTDGRLIDESVVGRSSGWTESFKAVDWNGDGLLDIVYSLSGKSGDMVYLLLNAGSAQAPVFALPQPIRVFGQPIHITNHGPHVGVADLDGDGRPEVIGCTEWSVYAFYRGTALAMSQRPSGSLGVVYRASVAADLDGDGDVDMDDFGHLQICRTGSFRGPPAPGCESADLDNEGDVDGADLSIFLQCASGAGIPAQLDCGG